MNQVYKIVFNKSSFDLDKDYERLSEHDKSTISSMAPDSFFDFNDDQSKYNLYLIFSPIDIEKYSKILDGNLIEHSVTNVSEGILENRLCLESEIRPFVNPLNRFRWNNYKTKVDEWIYENLDMDLVLDRIGQCGMENLRPVEKKFLRNYQS